MLSKNVKRIILIGALATVIATGIGGTGLNSMVSAINGTPTEVYAYSDSFNPNKYGMRTETGWVTSKVKCVDNIPENATLDQLKKMSIKVSPETHPQLFMENGMAPGTKTFNIDNMNLTNEIYYWSFYDEEFDIQEESFIKILGMEATDTSPKITKAYSSYRVVNGMSEGGKIPSTNYIVHNKSYYDILKSETSTPTPNPDPNDQIKKYSAIRLGGSDRFTTATAIAKQVNPNKLDAVVIANGFNFPDALAGTTLAGQKNAPILLVGSDEYDVTTLNYLKTNLKSTGTVYLLGGNGVVTDKVANKIKSLGFKNIKRLGGANRYDTNMAIVDELNVPKGTNVVIANSNSYADSLSISGVAGGKNMPVFLVNDTLTSTMVNKIKSISPKNIYIVGDVGVVNSSIEKKLKTYANVVRLGGPTRFETSLKVANYFTNTTQTTAAIAYSHNFPDALTGGALASKTASPILLVRGDAKNQKAFLDKTKINKLYILGGTGVISDTTVNQLTK